MNMCATKTTFHFICSWNSDEVFSTGGGGSITTARSSSSNKKPGMLQRLNSKSGKSMTSSAPPGTGVEGDGLQVSDLEKDATKHTNTTSDNDHSFGTITSHSSMDQFDEISNSNRSYRNRSSSLTQEQEIVVEEEINLDDLKEDHNNKVQGTNENVKETDPKGDGKATTDPKVESEITVEAEKPTDGEEKPTDEEEKPEEKKKGMSKWKIAGLAVAAAIVIRAGVEVLAGDDNDDQADVAGAAVVHSAGSGNAASSSAQTTAAAQAQAQAAAAQAQAAVAQATHAQVAVAQAAAHAAQ